MDLVFKVCNFAVLPFWGLMIFAPRWSVTQRVFNSLCPVAVFAVVYTVLIVPRLPVVFPVVARPELGAVRALLGSADGAVIGWVHYLAVDLFVGRWAYLDSRTRGVSPWLMAPILTLTLIM